MSIYRFSAASPVSEVAFRYADDRPPVGLISAAPSVGAEQLAIIRRAMETQGWTAVPATAEGRPVLQVSGFRDEGQLAALLVKQSFAAGTPQVEAEPGDHPTRSFTDWLKDNSLKVGGILNLVGDGALLASGIAARRDKEATAGALYTAGGLIAARYGNVKTEYHLRQVSAQLGEYLQAQSGELPEGCGLSGILRDHRNGVLQKAEAFFNRYPSQAALGAYSLGAVSMLQSGIQHGKGWDTAYGVNSVATKVVSLLVPEKSADEAARKGGFLGWIQEKPLRIFGYGSMISDALLGMSAYREYRTNPAQKSYVFKFLTTGTYLAADLMFAISSKKASSGKFDADEQREIEALAAEAIGAQPKAVQQPLANRVAGFLSTRPEMAGTAAEIAASIARQAAEVNKNPWACRVTNAKGQISNVNQVTI